MEAKNNFIKLLELINLIYLNNQLKKERIMENRNEKLKKLSIMEAKAKGRNELIYATFGDTDLYRIKNIARKKWFNKKIQEVK